jgi:hypothetical protein
MKAKVVFLLLLAAVLLSGCDVLNERARLQVESQRLEAIEAQARAAEAQARADVEREKWSGAAVFVGVTSVAMQPLVIEFLGFLLIVLLISMIGPPMFERIAYSERFRKDVGDEPDP